MPDEPSLSSGSALFPCRAVSKASRARPSTTAGRPKSTTDEPRSCKTRSPIERARSIISRNDSPDIGFAQSINPYRGCEHGCIYCYARPSHAYLELSPGLDFETKLFAKTNAAELLQEELAKPGYRPSPIALRHQHRLLPADRAQATASCASLLEVLAACEHPLTIVTKSALIERDLDLLAPMAKKNLVKVFVSITTLDHELARKLEPRAASPQRRAGRSASALAAQAFPAASWSRR